MFSEERKDRFRQCFVFMLVQMKNAFPRKLAKFERVLKAILKDRKSSSGTENIRKRGKK